MKVKAPSTELDKIFVWPFHPHIILKNGQHFHEWVNINDKRYLSGFCIDKMKKFIFSETFKLTEAVIRQKQPFAKVFQNRCF